MATRPEPGAHDGLGSVMTWNQAWNVLHAMCDLTAILRA